MHHYIKRTTKILIILLLLFVTVVLTGVRILLAAVEQYHQRIEQELSTVLNAPVKVGKIGTNLRGLEPELVFTNIAIAENDLGEAAIKVKEIRVSIDFLTALWHWDLFSAGHVTLVGAEFYVMRKPDGSVAIKGLTAGEDKPLWLLQGGKFEVIQSRVTWHDQLLQTEPHIFTNIDIAISNDYLSSQHTIHIRVNPMAEMSGTLRLSMQLSGDILSTKGITGLLYLEAKSLDINSLINEHLPNQWQLDAKPSDVKIWARWHQSRLISLSGSLGFKSIRLSHPDLNELAIAKLATDFNWQRQGQKWQLNLKQLFLDDGGSQWSAKNVGFALDNTLPEQAKAGLTVAQLDLGIMTKIADLLSGQSFQQLEIFKQFQLQGQVRDLSFYANNNAQTWAINGDFDQVGFKSVAGLPGINQLSGNIQGSHNSGRLILASNSLELISPTLFRRPIWFSRLQGGLDWQKANQQWHFVVDDLILETAIIKTRNRGQLTLPENLNMDAAFVDIQSHFIDGDLAKMKAYLPVDFFDEDLTAWLEQAFVQGQIQQGNALFYGRIDDYPFTGNEGLFDLQFDAKNIELDYQEGWPNFTGFDVHLAIHNDSLSVTANDWHLNGATISDTKVSMASMENDARMHVSAKITGKIEHCLDFLQRTPLQTTLAAVTQVIKATGDNVIDLSMQLPMIAAATVKIDGVTRVNNARMQLLSTDIFIENMIGELHFNERGVFTEKAVTAKTLNHPIALSIVQHKRGTQVKVNGRMQMIHLQDHYPKNPLWSRTRGQLQYALDIDLPFESNKSGKVQLTSNLKEVSLLLPDTLAKASGQAQSLIISADLDGASRLPIKLNYANKLQAALMIDPKQLNLLSGEILWGTGHVDFQNSDGVKLTIKQPRLQIDPWLVFLKASEQRDNDGFFNKISRIDVDISQLLWQDYDFKAIDIKLNKSKNNWQGSFASSMGKGSVRLPETFSTSSVIDLNLDFIDLSKLNLININQYQNSTEIFQHPQLNVNSQHLLWRNVDLGQFKMHLIGEEKGVRINAFEILTKDHQLTLKDNWINRKDKSNTFINGKLKVNDLGNLLRDLNINKEMQGSKSSFDFFFSWPGTLYQFDLAKVEGCVKANLEQGSLLGIEPGFGRILGAFDLAEWRRRISLDFSDIVAKGLAYNSITGLFYLRDGNAEIDNLTIDGVSAKIEISGRMGLVAQDYDQIVTVTPKSTAVIPFAGTIIGFVVQTITGSHPDSLTSSQYEIKGSWVQPEIVEKHENDGVLRKVWSGFTQWINRVQLER